MKIQFALLGLLALSVTPMGAGAQPVQPNPQMVERVAEMMTEADQNGDGKTTRAEFDQHRAQTFEKLDRNGDKIIDKQDSPRIPVAKRKFDPALERVTKIYDRNGDGRVTMDEWNRSEPDIFAMLDSNDDGAVARSELPKPK